MIPKGRFISEIGDGDRVKAVFLISERRLLTARNGKPYGKVIVSDKTGEMLGLLWDDAPDQIAGIAPGDVVGIRASAESSATTTDFMTPSRHPALPPRHHPSRRWIWRAQCTSAAGASQACSVQC